MQDSPRPAPVEQATGAEVTRRPFTFHLDPVLVERARREVGESEVLRSIEAALAAAVDYQLWVREVTTGARSAFS